MALGLIKKGAGIKGLFLLGLLIFASGCLKVARAAYVQYRYHITFPVDVATTTNVSEAVYKSLWRVLGSYSFPLVSQAEHADYLVKTRINRWQQKHRLESELWYDYQTLYELEATLTVVRRSDMQTVATKNFKLQTFVHRATATAQGAAIRKKDEEVAADRLARLIAVFIKQQIKK